MCRRDLRLPLALAALAALLGLVIALADSPELLLAVPLLVMLLPLLSGRYVGEEAISRLRRAVPPPRRRTCVLPGMAERPSRVVAPRGGRLLAFSIAVRPPPFWPAARRPRRAV